VVDNGNHSAFSIWNREAVFSCTSGFWKARNLTARKIQSSSHDYFNFYCCR
jgi:hypothetical protein